MELLERIRRYCEKLPPAVDGCGGQSALWSACNKMVRGFELDHETACNLLLDCWNARCVPPWDASELLRTCERAERFGMFERGRLLRDGENGASIVVPAASVPRVSAVSSKPGGVSEYFTCMGDGPKRTYFSHWKTKTGKEGYARFVQFSPDFYVQDGRLSDELQSCVLFDYRGGLDGPAILWKRLRFKPKEGERKGRKIPVCFHWNSERRRFEKGDGGTRPDGRSVYEKIPFRFSDVKERERVFIVEGEKSAVMLNAFLDGLPCGESAVATCVPCGARGWKPEYVPMFLGKSVCVIADNDEAGRGFGAAVVSSLVRGGVSVWYFHEYPAEFEPKDDIVEVLEAGRRKQTVQALSVVDTPFFEFVLNRAYSGLGGRLIFVKGEKT